MGGVGCFGGDIRIDGDMKCGHFLVDRKKIYHGGTKDTEKRIALFVCLSSPVSRCLRGEFVLVAEWVVERSRALPAWAIKGFLVGVGFGNGSKCKSADRSAHFGTGAS